MEQKYNIIGDTHGRTAWKDLVISDGINIFVGDYFSPYVNMSFEDQLNNFLSIIDYKREHPETVLLIGNHDDQHWKNISMRTSRFDFYNWKTIQEVLKGVVETLNSLIDEYKEQVSNYENQVKELNGKIESDAKSLENLQTIMVCLLKSRDLLMLLWMNIVQEYNMMIRKSILMKWQNHCWKLSKNYHL